MTRPTATMTTAAMVNEGCLPIYPLGNVKQILPKPIHPHLKLHGVDSGIRHGEPCIGNMFVADACRKRPAVVIEELEAQRGVREEVNVRRIQRHCVVAEEHSTAELEIRHDAGRA